MSTTALKLPRRDTDQPALASGAKLRFSLPGEWIDRRGHARPRLPVRRIAVIKPDHIGDLLIASRAFRLLRHYFPHAQIDLICGPWNLDLARRLGVFDNVHGVDLFHEVSGQQSDREVAEAARRRGIERLQALALGPYDVAIDLRYDRDSRAILQALDARINAGFGQHREFPFLDIAIPIQETGADFSAGQVVILPGTKFHRDKAGLAAETAPDSAGRICPEKTSIELTFLVSTLKSPAECGTNPHDKRPLGIGIESITASPVRDGEPLADAWQAFTRKPGFADLVLTAGWSGPEPWGAWGLAERCSLQLALPPSRGETHVRLDLSLVAHVNAGNPELDCVILHGAEGERVSFVKTAGRRAVSILVPRYDDTVRLVSEPFALSPGAYEGDLRLYLPHSPEPAQSLTLTLRSANSGVVLLRRQASAPVLHAGLCDVPLACWIELAEGPLSLEVEVPDAAGLDGARIELFSLRRIAPLNTRIPPTHMETRACLLVMQLALEFSDEAPFGNDDIATRLSAPNGAALSDNALPLVVARLEAWKQSGLCVIGVGMGCSSEIRRWPAHYFVELARELTRLERVRLVFIGSQGDRENALQACTELGLDPEIHALCGLIRLADLGQVLHELDLFIGNNTGTVHYAGRAGVRTIGIYAGTNHPREFGPVGPNTSWLVRDEACAPCHLSDLRDCAYGHRCLRDILPQDVLAFILPEIAAVVSARAFPKAAASLTPAP